MVNHTQIAGIPAIARKLASLNAKTFNAMERVFQVLSTMKSLVDSHAAFCNIEDTLI